MGNFTIVILVSGNIGTVSGPFSVREVVHKVDLILMYLQNIQHLTLWKLAWLIGLCKWPTLSCANDFFACHSANNIITLSLTYNCIISTLEAYSYLFTLHFWTQNTS